jgi:hypothetical protein
MIRYPRPEFTAIISAATTTSQATPSPMRMPVTIWGSAAGSTTERKSRNPENSKFRAARRYFPSIVATPAAVPTTIGKNDERKIRKMGERSPTPNHRMASGIQAIGEIGRRPWTSGFRYVRGREPAHQHPDGHREGHRQQVAARHAKQRGHHVLEQEPLPGQVDQSHRHLPGGGKDQAPAQDHGDVPGGHEQGHRAQ